MKHLNILENTLIVCGVAISMETIQTIMGVVLLAFQVVLILFKAGKKIYNLIKAKKYNEVANVIEETKGQIEDLKNKNDGKHD